MLRHLPWQISSLAIASLLAFPLLTLVWLSQSGEAEVWSHLSATVLGDYVIGSLQLMFGVAALSLLLGVGSAWLVTQYQFKGVAFFNWALLLPLAMPAYITAYSYTGLLDVAGPLQHSIRSIFNLSYGEYWFPEIRSVSGAIFVMSFVLYPYVYLLARASFLDQSATLRDASQLLGLSRPEAFFKVTLPIARPAIVAGLSLALMETLADYGTVSYFGVSTFTTGIFRTWYGLDSVQGAAQLALMLLTFVIVLLALEKNSRRRASYHESGAGEPLQAKPLSGFKQWLAISLASLPLLLGFVVPSSQLLVWAFQTYAEILDQHFWTLVLNSLSLASITAVLAVMLALALSYANRIAASSLTRFSLGLSRLGYAIPGTVIAVGVLIPLAGLDNFIDGWLRRHFDISTGLLISGTISALVIAYLARFLAVSLNSIEAGFARIGDNMDRAARSLGLAPKDVMLRVHIPLLKTSVLTALLIVFVDVMKELPATLILRPFNFNTLAVRAYELASDERLADASLASLAIVMVGLLPVILLSKGISTNRPKAKT